MKTAPLQTIYFPCLAAALFLAAGSTLNAAVIERETEAGATPTETGVLRATGKVFSVEPELLSVVIKDNPTPLQFSYSRETPIEDEKGATVPVDLLRVDLPLTVQYVMAGETMAAQRIVISRSMIAGDAGENPGQIRKELAAETTLKQSNSASEDTGAVETVGALASIEQTISLIPRGGKLPIMCVVNSSTRFVNGAGQPVGTQPMASGMPITVKSFRDGSRMVAQEIVFHGLAGGGRAGGALTGAGGQDSPGDNNGAAGRQSSTRSSSGTNSPGGGNLDTLPLQGYILPGQLPGNIFPRPPVPEPGAGGNNAGQNPSLPSQPGGAQSGNRQGGGNPQPSVTQPATPQPNVPPAGNPPNNNGGGNNGTNGAGNQNTNRNTNGNNGNPSGGNNSGTGGGRSGSGSNSSSGGNSGSGSSGSGNSGTNTGGESGQGK